MAVAIKATADVQIAEAAFSAEQTRLHTEHRTAMAKVDEWQQALEQAKERTRRIRQKGPITDDITQVQVRAANQRKGTAESDGDLHSDTVTNKAWRESKKSWNRSPTYLV